MYQIIYYFYPIMNSFEIRGGNPLNGEVIPQGAKNEALQIIAATMLTKEKIVIKNIPDIQDVRMLIELMKDLGVEVERIHANQYTFQAKEINLEYLISPEYKKKSGKLRGAVMLAGPFLARFKKAYIPQPTHHRSRTGASIHWREFLLS